MKRWLSMILCVGMMMSGGVSAYGLEYDRLEGERLGSQWSVSEGNDLRRGEV